MLPEAAPAGAARRAAPSAAMPTLTAARLRSRLGFMFLQLVAVVCGAPHRARRVGDSRARIRDRTTARRLATLGTPIVKEFAQETYRCFRRHLPDASAAGHTYWTRI